MVLSLEMNSFGGGNEWVKKFLSSKSKELGTLSHWHIVLCFSVFTSNGNFKARSSHMRHLSGELVSEVISDAEIGG